MYVLCWQFLSAGHWTEQQFDGQETAAMVTAGHAREGARQRDRYHWTRVLNQSSATTGCALMIGRAGAMY